MEPYFNPKVKDFRKRPGLSVKFTTEMVTGRGWEQGEQLRFPGADRGSAQQSLGFISHLLVPVQMLKPQHHPSALTSCFVLFLLQRVYVTVTIAATASGEAKYYIISYLCLKTSVVHICQQFLLLGITAYN